MKYPAPALIAEIIKMPYSTPAFRTEFNELIPLLMFFTSMGMLLAIGISFTLICTLIVLPAFSKKKIVL